MALLMRELNSSDDESDIDDMADSVIPIDPAKPWLKESISFLILLINWLMDRPSYSGGVYVEFIYLNGVQKLIT
jgi:hypothetical protein